METTIGFELAFFFSCCEEAKISRVLIPCYDVQVFSMLDTQSLCYASATCSFFSKCAKDPLCYANLDLTTLVPKVNNAVVATMIQRAGKALRYEILGLADPFPSLLYLLFPGKLQLTAWMVILGV